jgi:hypothetical protein
MPLAIAFWVVFLVYLILCFSWIFEGPSTPGGWRWHAFNGLVILLIFLLGWGVFGFIIKG